MREVPQEYARYCRVTPEAEAWGVVLRGAGASVSAPGAVYPPAGHPADHMFDWERGRVLGGWQLVLITEGEGEFEGKGTVRQRVQAGDVLWLAAGRWHRYRPLREKGWSEHWLEVGGAVPTALVAAGLLPAECRVIQPLRAGELLQVLAEVHRMLEGRLSDDLPAEQAVLALRALGLLAERRPHVGTRLEQAVRQAEQRLAACLAAPPSMPALARELKVNYAGFRKEFRRRTGLAPRQYLLRLRLEQAQRMIGLSAFTLEAIAEQLGFSSAFHLSAAFKQRFGVSPSAWRAGRGHSPAETSGSDHR